jgi:hypothetical protein
MSEVPLYGAAGMGVFVTLSPFVRNEYRATSLIKHRNPP